MRRQPRRIIGKLNIGVQPDQSGRISLFSLALVLVLCAVFYYFPDRPLHLVGALLVTSDEPASSDGIVILLGGDSPNRIIKAGQLYKDGIAPIIVFSSGFVDKAALEAAPPGFDWDAPSVSIVRALKSLGVPESAIRIVPASAAFDTSHELQSIATYAKKQGWTHMTLVSTPSHTHRVSMVWRRVGGSITADIVPSDAPGYDRWWEQGRYRREVAYEYLSSIKEFWSKVVDWSYRADHESDENGAKHKDSEPAADQSSENSAVPVTE